MATWKKWTSTVLVNGQPEPNVKVYVYEPGTTNEIPIYEDEGVTPITQPILTDSQGRYAFFVDVETYPEIRLYLEKDGVDFFEVNEDLDGVPVPGAGGGAGTFTELTDTPSSYVGRGGDVVVVKNTEDGIETQPWPVTGTVLNVFLSSDAADIGDYYYMYHTETGDTHSEFTSPSLSAGNDQLLWSFVTEAGQPGLNQLALGAYTATLFLKKSGNKDVRVYWKLFKRDTSGNETEILESAVSDHLTTDNSQYLISAYLNEDQVLDPTDRLVLKLYANVSGTGTDVTVTLTMEGDYDSRLTINVLSSAFNFDRLSDTPSSKMGAAGKYVRVSADETALEFDGAADMETESRTIYVDADNGDDTTGDGSAGNPYRTYAKALSTVRNVIGDGVTVTIFLKAATATYTPVTTGRLCIGSGKLLVKGELTSLVETTCTGGTATTIVKSGAGWTENAYQRKLVKFTKGGTDYWRIIESNTSDTLTVIGRLDVTPSSGDSFVIYDWASKFAGNLMDLVFGVTEFEDCAFQVPIMLSAPNCVVTLTRCQVIPSESYDQPSVIRQFSDLCFLTLETCILLRNSVTYQAIRFRDYASGFFKIYRSFLGGSPAASSWVVNATGAGVGCRISNGTIIDGAGSGDGIRLERGAIGLCYSGTVNGAKDKITIRNCSDYGVYADAAAGITHIGTEYVNYSSNGTDYAANSSLYAWYKEA